jgi:hypothetical protein
VVANRLEGLDFRLDPSFVFVDELVCELGEDAILGVSDLAVDIFDLAGNVVLLRGRFELLADELRAGGFPGPRLPVDEDVRGSIAAERGDQNRRHPVDLVVAVGELVRGVGRTEDLFVLEDRLAGQQVVEQPLALLAFVEHRVEIEIGRGG